MLQYCLGFDLDVNHKCYIATASLHSDPTYDTAPTAGYTNYKRNRNCPTVDTLSDLELAGIKTLKPVSL